MAAFTAPAEEKQEVKGEDEPEIKSVSNDEGQIEEKKGNEVEKTTFADASKAGGDGDN